ncbi:acyl-CoA dehydrogenase family protein [Streptomyces sp. NPDC001941]|uniref:acyl-CoA dehydrogenase family protein n=1 Tax=Streptomyces sp. NPDC001941 TaxID=3154659 RepID=UPI00332950C4
MPDTTSGRRTPGATGPEPPGDPVARLERLLGDPFDASSPFSRARVAAADAAESYPAEAVEALDQWGLAHHYVPVAYGGRLDDHATLGALVRAVAARDLTTAAAHFGTFLGTTAVWVGGDDAAARRTAAHIGAGHAVSLGLTERFHDGDDLATEITAWPVTGGLLLNGEKAPLLGATRARLVCLLARTGVDNGPRAHSVLVVDRHALSDGTCEPLPKIHTQGLRGADLSGVAFTDAVCPDDSTVGTEGQGGEIVLKALQLARAVAPALSLGAGTQAVSLALAHAPGNPLARRVLGEAAADLLAADALATVTARGVHVLPEELSVMSAAASLLVPELVADVFARLDAVFGEAGHGGAGDVGHGGAGDSGPGGAGRTSAPGATAAEAGDTAPPGATGAAVPEATAATDPTDPTDLSNPTDHFLFRKAARDHAAVRLLGGGSAAHLHALAAQFRHLATGAGAPDPAVYAAGTPLPGARLDRLTLQSRQGSSLLADLPGLAADLAAATATDPALAGAARIARSFAERSEQVRAALPPTVQTLALLSATTAAPARRLAVCLAAAACLGVWRHAPGLDARWPGAQWLEPALRRLWLRLDGTGREPLSHDPGGPAHDALADRVRTLADLGSPATLLPSAATEGAAR